MSWNNVEIATYGGEGYFLSKLPEGETRLRIVSSELSVWKGFPADQLPSKCVVFHNEEEAKPYNSRFDKNKESERRQMAKQRFYCFVILRKPKGNSGENNDEVKVFDMGSQIANGIQNLATDKDYGFDDIPPYDVKIKRVGKELDTVYSVLPLAISELKEEEKNAVRKFIAENGTLAEIAFGKGNAESRSPERIAQEKKEAGTDLPDFKQVSANQVSANRAAMLEGLAASKMPQEQEIRIEDIPF